MNEQSVLDSIENNPDDDTTKLIYADWLDERGDPRGQLIRLAVELRKNSHQIINESDTEKAFKFGKWMKALKIPFEPKAEPEFLSIPTPLIRSVEIDRDAEQRMVDGMPRYIGFQSWTATIEVELDSQAAAEIVQLENAVVNGVPRD